MTIRTVRTVRTIRTRFAPSPTGFLHIGGARTALFSWAYARRHGGKFVLRIEDTDLERSTEASVNAILESMRWLGLDWDEGPFFQMQRLARYREVADQLIAAGHAYYDYMSREELEALRKEQQQRGEKPRYDGRWRPGHNLKVPPGVKPVVRFLTPQEGEVGWHDLVKGPISFPNKELDDLVILRADGVPTYNFGVVVDDLDMDITHVIRGDDHVNNTPRQLHIFKAMGKPLPEFAHLPMILGADGERLSKRHGAVGVMQYHDDGYLPGALLNYLARLGWSHGNEEVFSLQQMVEWFDLRHVSHSAAKFDPEKLAWLNGQHLKALDNKVLAAAAAPFFLKEGVDAGKGGPALEDVVGLVKDRAATLDALARSATYFYRAPAVPAELLAKHLTPPVAPALADLQSRLQGLGDAAWTPEAIGLAIKEVLKAHNLKMPQIAMPLRVMVAGKVDTPSIDKVLWLLTRKEVLVRLAQPTTIRP